MARQRNLVDQQQRLSEATWSVLTSRGLAGLTLRAVAESAGCTTGLVMHAFPTKEALLLHARDLLHERTRVRADAVEAAARAASSPSSASPSRGEVLQNAATQRFRQQFGASGGSPEPGEAALEAVLLNALSLDQAGADEARVWVSFLAAALVDPVLAERHRAGNRSFVARVARLLGECRPGWESARVDAEARALVALAEGMNTLGAADPETYPPEVQRRSMTDALARAIGTEATEVPDARAADGAAAPDGADDGATAIDDVGGGAITTGAPEPSGMRIRSFDTGDTEAVVALWAECGLTRPWNDPRKDIERKLAVQPELFLVGVDDHGTVVATAMVGYDGHRGWVNYLAVDPGRRGRGDGRALMQRAEALLEERGCPKLNLQIREGNDAVMDFYRALGYTRDGAVGFGKRLIPDA